MSCQRRASSFSSSLLPTSSSSTPSPHPQSSASAPCSPTTLRPCPSLLIRTSSSSSVDDHPDVRDPHLHLPTRPSGRCCLISFPSSSSSSSDYSSASSSSSSSASASGSDPDAASPKSSSCPSLAALFRRDQPVQKLEEEEEGEPSSVGTTGTWHARPSSASPTLPHHRRSRSRRHRPRGRQPRQPNKRQENAANNTSRSSKGRRRGTCRWPSSIWPSFVSRWRSRIGGAGLHLLALQFCWVLPYLCFANYLERCLLPLRMYCYTQPDLLHVRRPVRADARECAAHLFANNAAHWAQRVLHRSPDACTLNRTLAVVLEPWRTMAWANSTTEPAMQRVFVIRSAPRAAEYRKYIRASWKPAVERLEGPVVFVTGQDGTELGPESAEHGDILQLAFEDSYRNLTLKMMGIYGFFTERTRVQQIVVINDDTIVNATALEALFRDQPALTGPAQDRYMIGKVSRAYPRIVFPWLPWYVDAELYPHKCYPPFSQGSSFVISRAAAVDVLRAVCEFPGHAIHLDDILMGLLTNCLGITNFHRDGFDVGHSLDSFTVFHYQFSRYSADTLGEMFGQVRHRL